MSTAERVAMRHFDKTSSPAHSSAVTRGMRCSTLLHIVKLITSASSSFFRADPLDRPWSASRAASRGRIMVIPTTESVAAALHAHGQRLNATQGIQNECFEPPNDDEPVLLCSFTQIWTLRSP